MLCARGSAWGWCEGLFGAILVCTSAQNVGNGAGASGSVYVAPVLPLLRGAASAIAGRVPALGIIRRRARDHCAAGERAGNSTGEATAASLHARAAAAAGGGCSPRRLPPALFAAAPPRIPGSALHRQETHAAGQQRAQRGRSCNRRDRFADRPTDRDLPPDSVGYCASPPPVFRPSAMLCKVLPRNGACRR